MIAQEAIRKAALSASVMDPWHRDRLLASLDPAVAERVVSAMEQVRSWGWDRPDLVQRSLASPEREEDTGLELKPGDLCRLATDLDSTSFSRVLAAQGADAPDFLMSMLDPAYAKAVMLELVDVPVLPDRLRAATLEAAAVLAANPCEESR